MPIEIEKKFRLTIEQRQTLPDRLRAIGATLRGEEFEENTLFSGGALELGNRILRLRRIGKRAVLTFKERLPSPSGTKHQQEDETEVADGEAMRSILERVGFVPVLVYEKRRETWLTNGVEIVLDELPFGLFMEIEGDEAGIDEVERRLEMHLNVEHSTYPQLTLKHGEPNGQLIEARFSERQSKD
jgi:adenylate cyclase class 2